MRNIICYDHISLINVSNLPSRTAKNTNLHWLQDLGQFGSIQAGFLSHSPVLAQFSQLPCISWHTAVKGNEGHNECITDNSQSFDIPNPSTWTAHGHS